MDPTNKHEDISSNGEGGEEGRRGCGGLCCGGFQAVLGFQGF